MIFSIQQASLAKALSIVSKGISFNATTPILTGIYLSAQNGTLELQSTDLTVSVRCKVPANVEEEGSIVLSGKTLNNIVKHLGDTAITFSTTTDEISSACLITSAFSKFSLIVLNPDEFPSFPEVQLDQTVELPATLLSSMVEKVYKVTSKDTSRPILSGIYMTVENNVIRLVATDSFRLAVCDTNIETSAIIQGISMILPGMVFHDVLSIPSDTNTITIGSNENQIVFMFGDTTYVARKIEGQFPAYKNLIPSSCATSVSMLSDDFSGALRRVTTISSNTSKVSCRIDQEKKQFILSTTSSDMSKATEALSVDVTGNSLDIALNYRYVEDCMSAIGPNTKIQLDLNATMQPAVFKTWGTINYLYLLMPVRM